jgi:hypothetical protein
MRGRVVLGAVVVAGIAVAVVLVGFVFRASSGPRIVLYGDSLSMQSAQDFDYLATVAGAPVLLRAYNGWAPCDVLPRIPEDLASWDPGVAVLEFSGNNFTRCMQGYAIGSAPYDAKYRADVQAAIDVLVHHGVRVILAGAPLDAWSNLSANVTYLNALYRELAAANRSRGVSFTDAGQSVLADGRFTMRLPCLPREPCTGGDGTNVVRSPDGVHFCPTGTTHVEGWYDLCDVYSSGAFRFATAMLDPALGRPSPQARAPSP